MNPTELDAAIEAWHDHGTGELWVWLKMTEAEYSRWVETGETSPTSADAPKP